MSDASQGRCFEKVQLGKGHEAEPRYVRDYISWLAWEYLDAHQIELEEVIWEKEVWVFLLKLLPP